MRPGSVLAALAVLAAVATAKDPDVGKGMVEIVQERGYPIEEHYVDTEDGYILGAFRITNGLPGTPGASTSTGKPVALLQHGLLDSSYTWVNNFKNESLAYILADAGYDVWMTNSRGNFFSKRHKTLSPDDAAFWRFTYDEMAKYDLPANIEYILNATGKPTLTYIGHSQGTIQAFTGFVLNPAIGEKVNLFAALAPIAYLNHQKSAILSILVDLDVAEVFALFGVKDFLPDDGILQKLAPGLCKLLPSGCNFFLELLCGPSKNLNESRIDVYVSETPAGTSVMNMEHWAQQVKADNVQMYDYGCGLLSCENEKHYGQKTPPVYDLSKLAVPTALFAGSDDYLGNPTDVQHLIDVLPASTVVHSEEVPSFAHLDFTWGEDAHTFVYAPIVNLMKQFNPVP